MASRDSAASASRTETLSVRGEQSVFIELRRLGTTTVDMVRQNLEKMRERAEALREKTTEEEFSKKMKEEFQANRDRINEDLKRLELECERTKPNPNTYNLETPDGLQKLEEHERVWMEATDAVLTATKTATDVFKDLVNQAVLMLSDISTAMVNGETTKADKIVELFKVGLADKFVKKANTAPQEVQDGLATT
jgi:predicted nuclease with TOPRIM domain